VKQGLRVMDSDLHVIEPPDLWQRYLPERFRSRAPVGSRMGPRDISVLIAGAPPNRAGTATERWNRVLAAHMGPREADYAAFAARAWDARAQLDAMDREGIDVAVLFPSRGLFVLGFDSAEHAGKDGIEPELAAALARAYNDWLHAFCGEDPARLVPAAMVAPHDVPAAVDEVSRAVGAQGFRGIFLLPGWVNGRPWHHASYDPLWRECERLSAPVIFHGGGPDRLANDFGLGFGESLMMWHTFSHCLGPMSALVSLLGGGVLDRFPKLRVGFLEANCSWAPWLVHRLQDHYEDYVGRHEIELAREPLQAFRESCFVAIEADEKPARHYVAEFGDDNVAFSTDFPHPDSKFPNAVDKFLSLPLPRETQRKILWDNCARLYGLTPTRGAGG
jgi:predicted TIM-barrel fold metal-dependent hydrolase